MLVLDDVFAELDARRRRHLASRALAAEQVVVTAAVADDVPAELTGQVLEVRRDPGTGLSTVTGTGADAGAVLADEEVARVTTPPTRPEQTRPDQADEPDALSLAWSRALAAARARGMRPGMPGGALGGYARTAARYRAGQEVTLSGPPARTAATRRVSPTSPAPWWRRQAGRTPWPSAG